MTRFSKKNIYYKIVLDFIFIVFWSFVICGDIISNSENELYSYTSIIMIVLVCASVLYLFLIVYNIVYYYFSGYEITPKDIKCKRGVVFKKHSILEINKIHTINKKQNFIQKIFNIAVLLIDSGSTNTATQAEIVIIESPEVVDKLIVQINDLQKNEKKIDNDTLSPEKKEVKYFFPLSQKIKFSFFSCLNFSLILFFFFLMCVLCIRLICCIDFVEGTADFNEILLPLIICYVFMILMFFIFILLYSFFKYYDFRVYSSEDNIEIKYGLLETNSNCFSLNRIKAVVIRQSFVQRIMGYASINIEVIGYGHDSSDNNSNQRGLLIPFCRCTDIPKIINSILPMYVPSNKENHSKAFFPFVSWHLLFSGVFLGGMILTLLYEKNLLSFSDNLFKVLLIVIIFVYITYLIILLLSSLLQYKTSGITFRNENISIFCGGFIRKEYVIQNKNLIGIETRQTYFQKRKGICTYYVHFKNNALTNVVIVKSLDIDCKDKLESLLTL